MVSSFFTNLEDFFVSTPDDLYVEILNSFNV
jgi:hypothetical protein